MIAITVMMFTLITVVVMILEHEDLITKIKRWIIQQRKK